MRYKINVPIKRRRLLNKIKDQMDSIDQEYWKHPHIMGKILGSIRRKIDAIEYLEDGEYMTWEELCKKFKIRVN